MNRSAFMHTFVVYVEDRTGVLNRVASLFRRRGYNIHSLTVGETETPGISRMTITVESDSDGARRLEANLYKLPHVIRVEDITSRPYVARDLVLIKVSADRHARSQIMEIVQVFRARVVDVAPESLVVEMTGTEDKIEGLLDVLRPFSVIEMVRTGRVAITRGLGSEAAAAAPAAVAAREQDSISYSV
jgi:acetolactate synthase-1/3 small subunit